MSLQTVKEYLRAWHKDGAVREFPVSSATVELAAAALQVEPARIAKTLSFLKGDGCLLLVAAGDARIDNTRFKAAFGCKAKMPERERVEAPLPTRKGLQSIWTNRYAGSPPYSPPVAAPIPPSS